MFMNSSSGSYIYITVQYVRSTYFSSFLPRVLLTKFKEVPSLFDDISGVVILKVEDCEEANIDRVPTYTSAAGANLG
jgi:hypothetical protein